MNTNPYDLGRMGEWQRLSCDFEVPDYYDALIAVSTGTREPQEMCCCISMTSPSCRLSLRSGDLRVSPGDAAQALSGGLALQPDEFSTTWQRSPHRAEAGRAVFASAYRSMTPIGGAWMGRGADARSALP